MADEISEVEIKLSTGVLSVFRHLTLTPWYALGEFVDNSIDSYLKNKERLVALHGPDYKLRIDITFESGKDSKSSRILVEDNAAGIDEVDARRAFTPGVPPGDKSGISQFGIGMKSSALWYSSNFNITSSALGENVTRTVFFDVDKIINERLEVLPVESKPKEPYVHGTRIMLLNLNQGLPTGGTISKIKMHLASIYREYIKAGDVVMTVAGNPLEYVPPKFLSAPYWPAPEGPGTNTEHVEWITRVRFKLDESWNASDSSMKKPSPPEVSGWVGILAKGNTKTAGLSLLWKKKVIVGAGNVAEADTYRPANIYGSGNTYISQRVFGELDLSDLDVTAFKDGFVWLAGQQEEMERKLKEALETDEMPLLSMARNYRQTERGKPISDTVKVAVDDAVRDLSVDITNAVDVGINPLTVEPEPEIPEPIGGEESKREIAELKIPAGIGENVSFEVKDQPGDNLWLRVSYQEDSKKWAITVNRAHPFMDSFVHLPGADLNPVLRIALALGMAEIRAVNSAVEKPSFTRNAVNDLLRGVLARRHREVNE